jgi:hypothetical protein
MHPLVVILVVLVLILILFVWFTGCPFKKRHKTEPEIKENFGRSKQKVGLDTLLARQAELGRRSSEASSAAKSEGKKVTKTFKSPIVIKAPAVKVSQVLDAKEVKKASALEEVKVVSTSTGPEKASSSLPIIELEDGSHYDLFSIERMVVHPDLGITEEEFEKKVDAYREKTKVRDAKIPRSTRFNLGKYQKTQEATRTAQSVLYTMRPRDGEGLITSVYRSKAIVHPRGGREPALMPSFNGKRITPQVSLRSDRGGPQAASSGLPRVPSGLPRASAKGRAELVMTDGVLDMK